MPIAVSVANQDQATSVMLTSLSSCMWPTKEEKGSGRTVVRGVLTVL